MLLALDVGNTNIVIGVFDGDKLADSWRLVTMRERTSDELGILITDLFERSHVDLGRVKGIILSSVVPPLTGTLASTYTSYGTTREHLLDTITYAANQAVVTFSYVARPDVRVDLSGGFAVFHRHRLQQIRATAAGQEYARYRFQYEDQGSPDQDSIIGAFTDCNNAAVTRDPAPAQSLLRKVVRTGSSATSTM